MSALRFSSVDGKDFQNGAFRKRWCYDNHEIFPVDLSSGGGEGYSQKNSVGVCGPLPKTPTLFMTKICDIPYPIYDLTKNSIPYLRTVSVVRYNSSLVQTNIKLL